MDRRQAPRFESELNAARQRRGAVLFVQAELPCLTIENISALLDTAERCGGALAPDRYGIGTNAVARLVDYPFDYCFGLDSRRLHEAQLSAGAVVMRPESALDIDMLEDLAGLQSSPLARACCPSANGRSATTPRPATSLKYPVRA